MPQPSKTGRSTAILIVLLAIDLVFIAVSIAFDLGYVQDKRLAIYTDRGFAEFFQYGKFLWIALAFFIMLILQRQLIYGVGSFLFAFLLLDDSQEIHENVAGWIVRSLGKYHGNMPFLGLRNQDLGELLFAAALGTTVIGLGILAYRKGSPAARRVCIHLLVAILALAFVGVFIDMIAIMVEEQFLWLDIVMVTLEDGGEMVVVSVIAWYGYRLFRAKPTAAQDSGSKSG